MKLYGIAKKTTIGYGHGDNETAYAIRPIFIDHKEIMPPIFQDINVASKFIKDNNLYDCRVVILDLDNSICDKFEYPSIT